MLYCTDRQTDSQANMSGKVMGLIYIYLYRIPTTYITVCVTSTDYNVGAPTPIFSLSASTCFAWIFYVCSVCTVPNCWVIFPHFSLLHYFGSVPVHHCVNWYKLRTVHMR